VAVCKQPGRLLLEKKELAKYTVLYIILLHEGEGEGEIMDGRVCSIRRGSERQPQQQ
jgi:hypothetical protein